MILDDAGLGFDEHHEAWLEQIDSAEWILLKMSAWQRDTGDFRHLATGPLFDHLHKKHAEQLMALVNGDDLRLRDAAVSRGLSWEQTAQDLAQDLFNNPCWAPLAECAHVVVRLGAAGVSDQYQRRELRGPGRGSHREDGGRDA